MRRIQPFLSALLVLAACATEPKPLDLIQPEAVPKAIFSGEWNYKATVTDTEYDNLYTFVGEETSSYTGVAFKVRWEVGKDLLTAYRVPQRYRDAKGDLVENAAGQATPILAFAITKHYDIRYRYNATTREDLNVIEENTDRPWNEREYMEVDWSHSLVTNIANPTVEGQLTGEIEQEPIPIYENIEFWSRGATPDEDVLIDTRRWNPATDPEVYTINIDTRETITTLLTDWYQLYYGTYMEPVTQTIRHSLLKAPPPEASTYTPLPYPDEVFRRFGYFRTEYEVWDPERGTLENAKQYLANRWDFSNGKVLTWYASPSFQAQIDAGDADLKGYAERVVEEWNKVFKEALGRDDDPIVFAQNERLVDADGQPVLKADGTPRWKRELGDLRWSFLNFTTKPQLAAPLGYGPSTPDADSGELINGTVNVYGDWIDFVIRRAMDWYDVAAGNCTLDQVKDGYFFDPATKKCDSATWVGLPHGGVVPATSALTEGEEAAATTQETAAPATLSVLTPALATSYYPTANPRAPIERPRPESWKKDRERLRETLKWRQQHPVALDAAAFGAVSGTKYESRMVPAGNLHSLAPRATSVDDPAVVAALSPARRLSPAYLRGLRDAETRRSMRRDDPVMFEPNLHAFAEEMKDRPRDEVYKTLRGWVWYTSVLHEMGHTLGLRHNFRGSVDARNFPAKYHEAYAKYWDQVEALRATYEDKIQAGDAAAWEAYVEAVDRLPSTHNRWASSSIMDYMGDWVDWQYPVGSWDRAAILFAYGNKVEVREPGGTSWTVDTFKPGDFAADDPLDDATPAASGRVVRPYLFCSDEKLFDDFFCTHFDVGVTATEITRNFIRDANGSYFFRNFKRQSTEFDARRESYYIDRWLWHYYMQAKALTEIELATMRYDEAWDALWVDGQGMDAVLAGPETRDMKPGYRRDGVEDLLRATLLTYYYLLYDVLGRPDYGAYQQAYDLHGDRFWDWTPDRYVDPEAAVARVAPGTGWGWDDEWDAQTDYGQFYAHLTRIGVELDKVIALEILSVPAILNDPLTWEKANGLSFWNSLWTANGAQLWDVIGGMITDNFSHAQNPWCMKCDAACRADPVANPPRLKAYPVGYAEALAPLMDEPPALPEGTRCGPDELPVKPGMDALFAIYPIYYGIAGSSHPWYQNALSEHMDSQIVGGAHRFDVPAGATTAKFVNSYGTKTYLAVQTNDGKGISYRLAANGKRIRDRIDMTLACDAWAWEEGPEPDAHLVSAVGRTCDEVLCCFYNMDGCPADVPEWCEPEGWSWTYLYPDMRYGDLDRIEAMLMMMQDMIDIAGHYQWWVPSVLEEE